MSSSVWRKLGNRRVVPDFEVEILFVIQQGVETLMGGIADKCAFHASEFFNSLLNIAEMNEVFKNETQEKVLSPWVTLVTHTVRAGSEAPQDFHSLKQADYVSIFPVTADGRIPLVKQYRPALDRYTLELPSGLLDAGEEPQKTALRELFEETGYRAGQKVYSLGRMSPDTGRLENKLWAFVALDVSRSEGDRWKPELDMESFAVTKAEFKKLILDGEFDHALHLAVIAMAILRGHFSW